MVTNVPGSDTARGAEVMQYIPPFSVEVGSDGALDESATHPMLALVYRAVVIQSIAKISPKIIKEAQEYCETSLAIFLNLTGSETYLKN